MVGTLWHQKYQKYRCPECGTSLVWSLTNSRAGSSSQVLCSKNPQSSRLDWTPILDEFCFWEGRAVRRKDGLVDFYHKESGEILKPFCIE